MYVAAFFAFQKQGTTEVAIYWYQETLGRGHGYEGEKATILRMGRWIQAHERHFLQQSEYTLTFKPNHDEVMLVDLGDALAQPQSWLRDQDRIYKIVMPQSMRLEALAELNKMNINAYSIYQTEDALVESVAYRLFNESD
jgi:hypothetical protein